MNQENIETIIKNDAFRQELRDLINRYSKENGSNTPDFILAAYLSRCLENFDQTMSARRTWYGPVWEPKRPSDTKP